MSGHEVFQPSPIEDLSQAKVPDVYKMYSDRVAALRTTMALVIPVAIAAFNTIVNAKIDKPHTVICGVALCIAAFWICIFLKIKTNDIITDYEKIVTRTQRQDFRLLPLDSLMSAERYLGGKSEASYFWTFSTVISIGGAVVIASSQAALFLIK